MEWQRRGVSTVICNADFPLKYLQTVGLQLSVQCSDYCNIQCKAQLVWKTFCIYP